MPAVREFRQRSRRFPVAAAIIASAALALSRWYLGASSAAFAGQSVVRDGGSRLRNQRDGGVGREAVKQILRRDPLVNENMQRFVKLNLKVTKRQVGTRQRDAAMARLAKLGLADKIQVSSGIWHDKHPAVGDVYSGYYTHPDDSDDMEVRTPVEITITGEGTADWKENEDFGKATFQSDFAIIDDRDRAMYLFNKFNLQWRDFSKPVPTPEELEYVSLSGLRKFFEQVASVQGFPSEEEFSGACADPSKGMTLDEFLAWLAADDPAYLSKTFKDIYTGRRIRFETEETGRYIVLDGDFQNDVDGVIIGYMELEGKTGGSFNVKLTAQK